MKDQYTLADDAGQPMFHVEHHGDVTKPTKPKIKGSSVVLRHYNAFIATSERQNATTSVSREIY
jgi:hypothetical protein